MGYAPASGQIDIGDLANWYFDRAVTDKEELRKALELIGGDRWTDARAILFQRLKKEEPGAVRSLGGHAQPHVLEPELADLVNLWYVKRRILRDEDKRRGQG